jgi:protein-tyrosine phosphatase
MRPPHYEPWRLVVDCEQFVAKRPRHDYSGIVIDLPMVDEETFVIPEESIVLTAELASVHLDLKEDVLVHCTGGYNRSSLVTVEILKHRGFTPSEAVALLRHMRGTPALTNAAFERWALR